MDTKLGKVLSYCEKLPPLKPHDLLIMEPMWSHMKIWKIDNFTFTRLIASERGW